MHSSTPDSRPLVDHRDSEHECWLAMRSAYDNYKDASETLNAVASRASISISCWDRIRGIESLAAKQRVEFEKYIEQRLQYAEFVRDRNSLGAMHLRVPRTADDSTSPNRRSGGRGLWLGGRASKIAVGAALLCITGFILQEQRRIHDLDVILDETSATLNHSRDDHHALSPQLGASSIPKQLGSRKVVGATAASVLPDPKSVYRNAAVDRPVAQPENRITIQSPKSDGHNYYRFTLTPSIRFKQVGTIGLSLRKDTKHRYFDLCLMMENSKVEKKRVKLDVPIWIHAADRLQPVAVVVTRIEKNYVQGYLSEPGHRKPMTTATDQTRQRIRRRS